MFKKRRGVLFSWQGWLVALGVSMIGAGIFSAVAGDSFGLATTVVGPIIGVALIAIGLLKRN